MYRGKRFGLLSLSVAAVVLLQACQAAPAPAATTPAATAAPTGGAGEKVRVGYISQIHDSHLISLPTYASKQGVEVELVPFRRYNDVMTALSSGQLELGSMGYPNAAYVAENNVKKVKLISGLSSGAISLTVRNGVTVRDWPDLAGKKIGVLTGGTLEMFYLLALKEHGIDPKTIDQVNFAAPGPELVQSLKSGQLDAYAAFEPFNATPAVDGWAYYPPTELSKNSLGGINGALGANTDFLDQHPDTVAKALKALVEATNALKANPDAWAELAASNTGTSVPVVKEAIKHLDLDLNLYEAKTKSLARFMSEIKLVQADHSNEVAGFLDYGPLMKATGKSKADLGG